MPLQEKATLRLKCQFTDAERLDKGRDMADAQARAIELENEMKAISTQFKAQIAEAVAQSENLGSQIRTGYEMRQVECIVQFDWDEGKKRYVRTDTYDIARVEDITDDERQTQLDLERDAQDIEAEQTTEPEVESDDENTEPESDDED